MVPNEENNNFFNLFSEIKMTFEGIIPLWADPLQVNGVSFLFLTKEVLFG